MPVQVNAPLLCVSAANLSGRPGGAPEHPFVRATSLLHSHFCKTETLQEAIIRSVWQRRGGWGVFRVFHGSLSKSRGWVSVNWSCLSLHPTNAKCFSSDCKDHTPTTRFNKSVVAASVFLNN